MQTIHTRYLPPTLTKGARYQARTSGGNVGPIFGQGQLESYGTKGAEGCHAMAAQMLLKQLGWGGRWIGGDSSDGKGRTFICLDVTWQTIIHGV